MTAVEATLDESALSAFRGAFRGELVLPGDPGYESARRVWNATADRRPALVAHCTGNADVAAALAFAREEGMLVSVRGGAHSYPGFSTCDGGIVVDLSPMRRVEVDPDRGVARAEGGTLLGELDAATQAFGLACPSGAVAHTGIAGLTLGGGLGRLMRKHGLTIDNLLSVELVTASGETVRASKGENADLFWGLRGAGANFGVATAFEFRLHPVGPEVLTGMAAYPAERAHELASLFQDWAASAPDDVTASLGFGVAPAEPPFPPELAGRPIVTVGGTHAGEVETAERDLRPLRDRGPVVDTFAPKSYLELQRSADDYYAWGKRNYWKGLLLTELADEAIDVFLRQLEEAPAETSGFGLLTMGGAVARVPEDATAFSGRRARYWLVVETLWLDETDDERHFGWARGAMEALRPFATSANYVNDLGGSGDLRAAYGPAKYERLVALKREWDPDNVFRLNQNVPPR